jgi:hypothetical protein
MIENAHLGRQCLPVLPAACPNETLSIFWRYNFSWAWQIDDHHLQDFIQSLRGSESPTSALKFSDSTSPEKFPPDALSHGNRFFWLVLVL